MRTKEGGGKSGLRMTVKLGIYSGASGRSGSEEVGADLNLGLNRIHLVTEWKKVNRVINGSMRRCQWHQDLLSALI